MYCAMASGSAVDHMHGEGCVTQLLVVGMVMY